ARAQPDTSAPAAAVPQSTPRGGDDQEKPIRPSPREPSAGPVLTKASQAPLHLTALYAGRRYDDEVRVRQWRTLNGRRSQGSLAYEPPLPQQMLCYPTYATQPRPHPAEVSLRT